jgi:hypothetical protein
MVGQDRWQWTFFIMRGFGDLFGDDKFPLPLGEG